jgi:hypothetical protein
MQTYASHRRYLPEFHFFVLPVLMANAIAAIVAFARQPGGLTAWLAVVAIALALGMWTARAMALQAQNRVIRLEERLRLENLLPADLRSRVGDLSTRQLIALRFAPDDELPDLARRALAGELKSPGEIKRAIRSWRPDYLRV